MRISKRWQVPSLAPSTPPLESLHHRQPSTDPPIQEVAAPPRSDLQLTLLKGTNVCIGKTDEDCMHPTSSSQPVEGALPNKTSTRKIYTATTGHPNKDNSSGAKDSEGISSSASASRLEVESARKYSKATATKTNTTREVVEEEDSSDKMKKKRKKVDQDSEMADGTLCSRVNGRGWRCWEKTVVGYSLCEHHSTTQGRLKKHN